MKKNVLVLIAIFVGFVFISCSNGTTSVQIDKANIWLAVHAYPDVSVASGSTPYIIVCQIEDRSTVDGMGNFSDVNISLNGITIVPAFSDSNLWVSIGDISLAESDTLTVVISHPSFGSGEATGVIPPSISSFNVNPDLPAVGVANTSTSYDLSWTGIGVDEYLPMYSAYNDADGLDFIVGRGRITTGTSYTLNVTDGTPYPFIELEVSTIDKFVFNDFAQHSFLRVEGAFVPKLKNTN